MFRIGRGKLHRVGTPAQPAWTARLVVRILWQRAASLVAVVVARGAIAGQMKALC